MLIVGSVSDYIKRWWSSGCHSSFDREILLRVRQSNSYVVHREGEASLAGQRHCWWEPVVQAVHAQSLGEGEQCEVEEHGPAAGQRERAILCEDSEGVH